MMLEALKCVCFILFCLVNLHLCSYKKTIDTWLDYGNAGEKTGEEES